MITKDQIRKAIATVERSRQTHVNWIEHYDRYPEEEDRWEYPAGTRENHMKFVAGYDQVLRVLRAVLVEDRPAGEPVLVGGQGTEYI
jgi:hypothetical protein